MHKGSTLFLSKNAKAASTRYRIFQFIPYLEQHGWRCEYVSVNKQGLFSRLRLLWKVRRFDIVVIQRKLFGALFLTLLRTMAKRLVFDFDDAIFLNDDGSHSKRRAQRFHHVSRQANLVLAGNQYLASFSQCRRTEVFPTGIVFKRYRDACDASVSQVSTPDLLTLVWIGSRSTMKYLERHRTLLEKIGEQFSNIQFKIIADFELRFAHLTTTCISWSQQTELIELCSASIGIAPMSDDPWTRGKCALKVVQYMACGLPVVSSNCGANADIIQQDETGFLCNSSTDWINAIAALQDITLRTKMGRRGQEFVRQHLAVEALGERMNSLFTELATN